jgi:hypothetical protein
MEDGGTPSVSASVPAGIPRGPAWTKWRIANKRCSCAKAPNALMIVLGCILIAYFNNYGNIKTFKQSVNPLGEMHSVNGL